MELIVVDLRNCAATVARVLRRGGSVAEIITVQSVGAAVVPLPCVVMLGSVVVALDAVQLDNITFINKI